MLKSIRIEVEEETAEACVAALWKYEHGIQVVEAQRYCYGWPIQISSSDSPPDSPEDQYGIRLHPWKDGNNPRSFFNEQLGRELVEEVIEYDDGIPGYRGRRVVKYVRVDMRDLRFVPLEVHHVKTWQTDDEGETTEEIFEPVLEPFRIEVSGPGVADTGNSGTAP